jgi:hypothetical protein
MIDSIAHLPDLDAMLGSRHHRYICVHDTPERREQRASRPAPALSAALCSIALRDVGHTPDMVWNRHTHTIAA